MGEETNSELRRIRITLVVLVIIILFTAGNNDITVEHDWDYEDSNQTQYNSNMVPLDNGYFGVLTSDTDDYEKSMSVYFFDKDKKKLVFIKSQNLLDIE